MSIDALGVHLGPLYLRFYGLILVSGAMLAAYLVALEASRQNLDPNFAWDALLWCLVGGIIGARLYHVLTPSPSNLLADGSNPYFQNPMRIMNVWEGGLGIPGGVAGGALALWIFARRQAQSFVVWGDLAVAGLLLAQGIGRWGNYVNQELYGAPSQLPWAISISPPKPFASLRGVRDIPSALLVRVDPQHCRRLPAVVAAPELEACCARRQFDLCVLVDLSSDQVFA